EGEILMQENSISRNIRGSGLWGLSVQTTWAIPLVLSSLGILMISSVTAQLTAVQARTPFFYGLKQVQWLLVGLTAMIACTLPTAAFWRKWSGVIWFLSVLLMIMTLLPGLGRSGGGASRWVRLGPFSLQASEALLFATAIHLSRKLNEPGLARGKAIWRTLLIFGISAWPFLLQPDLGGTMILFGLAMAVFVQVFGWTIPLVAGSIASVAMFIPVILLSRYRIERITSFLDPWSDPLGSGFQTIQGFIAFANGGFFGVGIGHGLQKLQYLPAAHTDFILAVIGEEIGLIGTFSVILLFGIFLLIQYLSYLSAAGKFEATLVWAITLTIFIPFIVNAAGVLRLMPLTGVPLPFVSYGGSSMVLGWCKIGVLLRLMRVS
ncbi:MAG: putative peptidoglycan glycosyltransferase FtsW, partial [Synergistaceae bacterium]|nr:putative peptidoglycan glycosyltransferase FtsW [Synergistaceae bacterium]